MTTITAAARSSARSGRFGRFLGAYGQELVILGALVALFVVVAFVLRGPGGGKAGSAAAQGGLFTEAAHPDQA